MTEILTAAAAMIYVLYGAMVAYVSTVAAMIWWRGRDDQ